MADGKPGRPRGLPKSGGRKKGTLNKKTHALKVAGQQLLAKLKPEQVDALTPRDVMLCVMRLALDQGNIPLALAAADKVAPYCHARLAQTEVNATVRRNLEDYSTAELMAIVSSNSADSETSSRPN